MQQPIVRTRVDASILPPHLYETFQQGVFSKAPVFAGTTAPGGGGFWTCAACGKTTQYTLTKHLGYSIKPSQPLCPWLRLYHHELFKLLRKPRAAHGARGRAPSMAMATIPPKRAHLELTAVQAPTAAQLPYEAQADHDARSDDVPFFHADQQQAHDAGQGEHSHQDQTQAVLAAATGPVSITGDAHPHDAHQSSLAKCESQLQRLHAIQSNLHYQFKILEQQLSEAGLAISQTREEFQRLRGVTPMS